MHSRRTLAIMALSLGGCFILAAPPATFAQSGGQQHEKKSNMRRRRQLAPTTGAKELSHARGLLARSPHARPLPARSLHARRLHARSLHASRSRKTAPREAAPRKIAPHKAAPREAAPRKIAPRETAPRTGSARGLRSLPPQGASRTAIHGRHFTAWRSGYRARRGSGWRTFGALSALSAIVIGSSTYYPYAYISAPQPYCDGLTEDGCELMWQEVTTLEGDLAYQCVAYCPWQ